MVLWLHFVFPEALILPDYGSGSLAFLGPDVPLDALTPYFATAPHLLSSLFPFSHSCQGESFLADPALNPPGLYSTLAINQALYHGPREALYHMTFPTSCLPPLPVLTLLLLHWLACSP